MAESIISIDFTKGGNFKEFNSSVKSRILRVKSKKNIQIIDYIYPISKLLKKKYPIRDHINLSGFNPLSGPNFISLTNIYGSKDGIVVCGLKKGVQPNKKERKKLLDVGVRAYCYNLVSTVILAVSMGLKIKAIGVVRDH